MVVSGAARLALARYGVVRLALRLGLAWRALAGRGTAGLDGVCTEVRFDWVRRG